jgi:hypothetical protein
VWSVALWAGDSGVEWGEPFGPGGASVDPYSGARSLWGRCHAPVIRDPEEPSAQPQAGPNPRPCFPWPIPANPAWFRCD